MLKPNLIMSKLIPKNGFKKLDGENVYHCYPIGDEKPHLLECERTVFGRVVCKCDCGSETKNIDGAIIIFHSSFDGREGVEWANEILNR